MIRLDAEALAARLDRRALIDALDAAFRREFQVPARQHYRLGAAGDVRDSRTLLVMPAWSNRSMGVKLVTVFPENSRHNLPAVNSSYLLFDAHDGSLRAMLDGNELTLRRTAAASALASRYLSRHGSSRLTMIGCGRLAPHLIESHCAVRPIREVRIWGRRTAAADAAATALRAAGIVATATSDLEAAVRWADIVSCATLSQAPLVKGEWLAPGAHLDLVGSFAPEMCEADDEAVRRCEVFVDTREGALSEAGELVGAIARNVIDVTAVRAQLSELAAGCVGRTSDSSITLFKSVGTALEDLAAAELAMAVPSGPPPPG